MELNLTSEQIKTYINNKAVKIENLEWNDHPTFKGVSLKHIVTGSMVDNKVSCHLVKIEAGCEIKEHTHKINYEFHQTIQGKGTGIIDGVKIPYAPGVSSVVPEGATHKVTAGEEDLYFITRFIPALM